MQEDIRIISLNYTFNINMSQFIIFHRDKTIVFVTKRNDIQMDAVIIFSPLKNTHRDFPECEGNLHVYESCTTFSVRGAS